MERVLRTSFVLSSAKNAEILQLSKPINFFTTINEKKSMPLLHHMRFLLQHVSPENSISFFIGV